MQSEEKNKTHPQSCIGRRGMIVIGLIATVVMIGMTVIVFSPDTSSAIRVLSDTDSKVSGCRLNMYGACLAFPIAAGVDLNNQPVAFPDAFTDGWTLVVMPFDRDQQVLAATWLPLFQELSEVYDDVSFFSIAALPDLNVGVRTLVITGMRAGVRDADVRAKTTVLFLDDHQAYLDAFDIGSTDEIKIYITDEKGVVYWQGSGEYSETLALALRERLVELHQDV